MTVGVVIWFTLFDKDFDVQRKIVRGQLAGCMVTDFSGLDLHAKLPQQFLGSAGVIDEE